MLHSSLFGRRDAQTAVSVEHQAYDLFRFRAQVDARLIPNVLGPGGISTAVFRNQAQRHRDRLRECLLRLALVGMSLLSIMASAQTAMQVGIVPRDFSPPLLCAQESHVPIELNEAAACVTATTSSDLPEAPSASPGGPNRADGTLDVRGTRFMPPTLSVEPDTNRSGHTVDRNFILLHTFSALALVADLETTAHGLGGQAQGTELNPVFGAHPSRARLYSIAVPLDVLSLYVSYRYKRAEPGRSLWKLAPGVSIAAHTAAVVNNLIAAHR